MRYITTSMDFVKEKIKSLGSTFSNINYNGTQS